MRQLLSQMDVPTRQAWVMAIVEDHEREAAASATNLRRTVAAATPALTGRVMQAVALSAPFALGLSRARLVFQRRGAHYLRHQEIPTGGPRARSCSRCSRRAWPRGGAPTFHRGLSALLDPDEK